MLLILTQSQHFGGPRPVCPPVPVTYGRQQERKGEREKKEKEGRMELQIEKKERGRR